MKTAIIYSYNSPKSAKVAKMVISAYGEDKIESLNTEDIDEETFLKYDQAILSVPTWFDGELPNYWDEFVPAMEDFQLKGKTYAIFGLGDQIGYPENFVDGIGIMTELLEEKGAKIVGYTESNDYTFESSRALRDGKFTGLALDLENQAKKTKKRIEDWIKQIKKEGFKE